MRARAAVTLALVAITPVAPLAAQHQDHQRPTPDSLTRWSIGAMAIGVATRAAPAALGQVVTEGYLTQPMLLGSMQLAGGRLQGLATVNLEGLTLRRGEINLGVYGEGYVDRRHPHTYLHEAMLGTEARLGPARFSVFAGKGFVPFGTDDPMVRPFVKYPVNHHLAQVMERVLVVGAIGVGPVVMELARFNGDEPEGPADWPNAGRALDSWAARLTASVGRSLEVAVSQARVESPEFATGQGLDQDKRSVSARVVRDRGMLRYALVEWASTRELGSSGRTTFRFPSLLAEGMIAARGVRLAMRVERTERPEEDRLDNPYRSVRPLLDFNVLGQTRWEIATLGMAAPPLRRRWITASPFVEGAWHRPRARARPAALDPEVFYAARQLWTWSIGVRMHAGTMRPRFGRYGVAMPATSTSRAPADVPTRDKRRASSTLRTTAIGCIVPTPSPLSHAS
ncbi:MAG: hypothetical protein IT360_14000 [Gemmatimonadaceae bacterium]|nr:hypothetical protein [Gemmatimonadaceae bacterium]